MVEETNAIGAKVFKSEAFKPSFDDPPDINGAKLLLTSPLSDNVETKVPVSADSDLLTDAFNVSLLTLDPLKEPNDLDNAAVTVLPVDAAKLKASSDLLKVALSDSLASLKLNKEPSDTDVVDFILILATTEDVRLLSDLLNVAAIFSLAVETVVNAPSDLLKAPFRVNLDIAAEVNEPRVEAS